MSLESIIKKYNIQENEIYRGNWNRELQQFYPIQSLKVVTGDLDLYKVPFPELPIIYIGGDLNFYKSYVVDCPELEEVEGEYINFYKSKVEKLNKFSKTNAKMNLRGVKNELKEKFKEFKNKKEF